MPSTRADGDLTDGRTLDVDVERIDRMARNHDQAVAPDPAEADVGGALGQRDEADRLAGRIEHLDAVEGRAHAPPAPQVAVDVAAETVRRLVGLARYQHFVSARPPWLPPGLCPVPESDAAGRYRRARHAGPPRQTPRSGQSRHWGWPRCNTGCHPRRGENRCGRSRRAPASDRSAWRRS